MISWVQYFTVLPGDPGLSSSHFPLTAPDTPLRAEPHRILDPFVLVVVVVLVLDFFDERTRPPKSA
jgi:hypothetical protein